MLSDSPSPPPPLPTKLSSPYKKGEARDGVGESCLVIYLSPSVNPVAICLLYVHTSEASRLTSPPPTRTHITYINRTINTLGA